MTITIYELLGLVKDGKAPKKIKYDETIYIFDKDGTYFSDVYGREGSLGIYLCLDYVSSLNKTVEILEEENKIEKIKLSDERIIDTVNGEIHYIGTNRKDRDVYIPILNYLIAAVNKLKEDK